MKYRCRPYGCLMLQALCCRPYVADLMVAGLASFSNKTKSNLVNKSAIPNQRRMQ